MVIPDDVKHFLHSGPVRSVWALQVLVLLHDRRDHPWTAADLTHELRATHTIVQRAIAGFERAGLVSIGPDDRVQFVCREPQLESLVVRVLATYANFPVAVTAEIYSSDARARDFADAFKFRKE